MKLLTLSISLLLLSGCGLVKSRIGIPAFEVGDCIATNGAVREFQNDPKERWETEERRITMELVIEVGEKKYRTVTDYGSGRMTESSSKISWDNIMSKVECSSRLKEVKKELLK